MVKKSKERGLGRGLSALMSDVSVAAIPQEEPKAKKTPVKKTPKKMAKDKPTPIPANQRGVTSVAIDQLERNPDQPRKYFDKDKLAELTQSIKDKGVLQPILVRPLPRQTNHEKKHYQIVAGERRWQAALKAKLDTMPVLIRELSDQDVLEIGVVENVQRADLNPIEEALAYQALSEQFKRTQEDIAQAVGKSRPHVTNMLRLLTLPKRAQTYLAKGKITAGLLTQQNLPMRSPKKVSPCAKPKIGSAGLKRPMVKQLQESQHKKMPTRVKLKMIFLIF